MKIFEFIPEGVNDGNVRAWLHEYPGNDIPKRKRPAIVICPGGAYRFVSVWWIRCYILRVTDMHRTES